jgi:diguanylate cyclase (GGDEF)-like protein
MDAHKKAEKIRELVEESSMDALAKVTVSIGVSQLKPTRTIDEAIQKADEAMYQAKRDGRNRVQLES